MKEQDYLRQYAEESRARGISDREIRGRLISSGWHPNDVYSALPVKKSVSYNPILAVIAVLLLISFLGPGITGVSFSIMPIEEDTQLSIPEPIDEPLIEEPVVEEPIEELPLEEIEEVEEPLIEELVEEPEEEYEIADVEEIEEEPMRFKVMAGVNWWNTTFNKRKDMNITSSAALTNFTTYLNLTYDSDMQADFDDIRFINGSCVSTETMVLDYEIENYTTTDAHIWIRIPELYSGVTPICMYYNNATVSSKQNKTGAWDEYYVLVQHLQETDIDGGAGDIKDSTSFRNNGTTSGMSTSDQVAGKVDGSFRFTTSGSKYINHADDASLDITENITIEAWVYLDGVVSTLDAIVAKWDSQNAYGLYVQADGDVDWYLVDSGCSGMDRYARATTGMTTNNWYYITATYNHSTPLIYIDSKKDVDLTSDNSGTMSLCSGNSPVRIGVLAGYYIGGVLDEVRISNATRSADWINMSYEIVQNQNTLVTVGAEEDETLGFAPVSSDAKINDSSPVAQNTIVKVNASIIDADGDLANVTLEITPPVSSAYNITPDNDTATHFYNDTINLTEVGQWQFRFYANDTLRNNATATLAEDQLNNSYIEVAQRIRLDSLYPTPGDETTDINATQNQFFNVTNNVTCVNANCGEVNISLAIIDPEYSWINGSNRATGYMSCNKIVRYQNKTHVVYTGWNGTDNNVIIHTYDHETKRWSKVFEDNVSDTHGQGALAVDSQGYIHLVYGAHHVNLRYRKSTNPNDASAWGDAVIVGAAELAYPSMVIDSNDILHLIYRYSSGGEECYLRYQNKTASASKWSNPDTLFDGCGAVNYHPSYSSSIAVDSNDVLHIGLHIFNDTGGVGARVSYMKSNDSGGTWYNSTNDSYTLPVTHATAENIYSGSDTRTGNLYVDEYNNPFFVVNEIEDRTDSNATFWRHNGTVWNSTYLTKPAGKHLWADGSVSYFNNTIYAFISAPDIGENWNDSGNTEIFMYYSTDNGTTFTSAQISDDSSVASGNTWAETDNGAGKMNETKVYWMSGAPGPDFVSGLVNISIAKINSTYGAELYDVGMNETLINTTTGATPFFTNDSNPNSTSLNRDENILITWWANATGTPGSKYRMYTYANLTSDMSISNSTNAFEVTIIGAEVSIADSVQDNIGSSSSWVTDLPVIIEEEPEEIEDEFVEGEVHDPMEFKVRLDYLSLILIILIIIAIAVSIVRYNQWKKRR